MQPDDIDQALRRDPAALRKLVGRLTPVVQARVARGLRRRGRLGRDTRQEIEDFTQEVFVALFDRDARALRAWDPSRGMSLENFVGMFAEHQLCSIFRSGRRKPWTEEPVDEPKLLRVVGSDSGPEKRTEAKDLFARVLERLQVRLSPKGYQLFILLVVEERSVEEVEKALNLSRDAVYAWRSRLIKAARAILEEESTEPMSETGQGPRNPQKGAHP